MQSICSQLLPALAVCEVQLATGTLDVLALEQVVSVKLLPELRASYAQDCTGWLIMACGYEHAVAIQLGDAAVTGVHVATGEL